MTRRYSSLCRWVCRLLALCCVACRLAGCVTISFEELLYVPANSYLEINKNTVSVLEDQFNPGKIHVNLTLNATEGSDLKRSSFNLIQFSSCTAEQYICYIKYMQVQEPSLCSQLFENCDTCEHCLKTDAFSQNKEMVCCKQCQNYTLDLIPAHTDVNKVDTSSRILLIDNSQILGNLPTQVPINIEAYYQINLAADGTYYILTLVLAILLIISFIFLCSCLCILLIKYRKSKDKYLQMNLVTTEKEQQQLKQQKQLLYKQHRHHKEKEN